MELTVFTRYEQLLKLFQRDIPILISDVHECFEIVDVCDSGQGGKCINEQGKYSCECESGYVNKNGACVKGNLLMKLSITA